MTRTPVTVTMPAETWRDVAEMLAVDAESDFYKEHPGLLVSLNQAVAEIDKALSLSRFCTYEHAANGHEPAAMTEAEFNEGGRRIIEESDSFVWQYAPDAETAISQHVAKHDEWAADVAAGRPEKSTY